MLEIEDIIETPDKAPTLLGWQWVLIIFVTFILIIAILSILKRKTVHSKKINNIEQALTQLKKIHQSSDQQLNSNELSTELSLLTRNYLQGQFRNQSIFQTHEEFIADHEDLEKLPEPAREKLSQYLTSLANHKYTPNPDLPTEKNKLIELTESLLRAIDSTIPKQL